MHELGAIMECCHRYTPKLINIAKLNDCFVDDMECLATEFIDIKVIVSFHNRL